MSDRVADIAAAKIADGTWLGELEDVIASLESELERAESGHDQAGLRIEPAMRRDQLDKLKAYMETLPRIDIGEDAA